MDFQTGRRSGSGEMVTLSGYHQDHEEDTSMLVHSFDFGAGSTQVLEPTNWANFFMENEVSKAHEESGVPMDIKLEPVEEEEEIEGRDGERATSLSLFNHITGILESVPLSLPIRSSGSSQHGGYDGIINEVDMRTDEPAIDYGERSSPQDHSGSSFAVSVDLPIPGERELKELYSADICGNIDIFNAGGRTSGPDSDSLFVVGPNPVPNPRSNIPCTITSSSSSGNSSGQPLNCNDLYDNSNLSMINSLNSFSLDANSILGDFNTSQNDELMMLYGERAGDQDNQNYSLLNMNLLDADTAQLQLPIQGEANNGNPFLLMTAPITISSANKEYDDRDTEIMANSVMHHRVQDESEFEMHGSNLENTQQEERQDDSSSSTATSSSREESDIENYCPSANKRKRCRMRAPRSSENGKSTPRTRKGKGKNSSKTSVKKSTERKPAVKTKRTHASEKGLVRGSGRRKPSTFRVEMGPYLRIISAVMDVLGIKHESDESDNNSDVYYYEVLKRFKPVDMFRTLLKSTAKNPQSSNGELTTSSECYNWEQWNCQPHPGDDDPDSIRFNPEYIYYPSKAIARNGNVDQLISFLRTREVDGKPNYSPVGLGSVGSAELKVQLDLVKLAKDCNNTEFLEDGSPLVIRLRQPKCSGLIFETGKLIVIGAHSYKDFRIASRKFARMVQKAGNDVTLTELSIHYYMGSVKLPFNIDLRAMIRHQDFKDIVRYDFEVFPGVIIKLENTSTLCLIFDSGTIMFTNAAKREDMKKSLDMIYPCMRSFGYKF